MVRKFRSVTAPTPADFAAIERAFEDAMRKNAPAPTPPTPAPLTFAERRHGESDPSWDISIAEMTYLGEVRGRAWYQAPSRFPELADSDYEMTSEVVPEDFNDQRSPGLWIVVLTPLGQTYVATRRWPAGTYERLTAPKSTVAKPTRSRPVDALAGLALLSGRKGWGPDSGRLHVQPSAEAILARAKRLGVSITVSPDWQLLVSSEDGHVDPRVVDAIERARPLLVAHLSGSPLLCSWPHEGTPPAATTLSVGGAPLCSVAAHQVRPEPVAGAA